MHCFENAFCAALDGKTREKLCKHCVKATYAPNSRVDLNFRINFIVIEGLCLIKTGEDLAFTVRPGDFAIPPRFGSETSGILSTLGDEFKKTMANAYLQYPVATTCACFESSYIDEMREDSAFAKVMLKSLEDFTYQGIFYQLLVFHAPARDAVRYALNFCDQYGLEGMTHAQLATLTGRNRSTVTQVMHEIALSEGLNE